MKNKNDFEQLLVVKVKGQNKVMSKIGFDLDAT